jgi:hypothetical protein
MISLTFQSARFWNQLLNKAHFRQNVAPVRAKINTVNIAGTVYVAAQGIKTLKQDQKHPTHQAAMKCK